MRVLWWIKSVLVISSLTTFSFFSSSFYSTQQCSEIFISQQRSLLFLVSFPVPTPGLYNYRYTDSLWLLFMPSVINWYVENRYVTMDVLPYRIITAKILSSWLVFTSWPVDHSKSSPGVEKFTVWLTTDLRMSSGFLWIVGLVFLKQGMTVKETWPSSLVIEISPLQVAFHLLNQQRT